MKKSLQFVAVFSLLMSTSSSTFAQYCEPIGFYDGPWTHMSNVTFETLDNSSVYPTGVGADTGYIFYSNAIIPDIMQGVSYPIAVTADDGNIMGMELSVWIDWDQNQIFDPSTELVASWSESNSGTVTHNASVSVPPGATLGNTRMRVYCDMPVAGGHIASTPCGYAGSGNVVGHHGEVEDYTVNIVASSGLNNLEGETMVELYPNPSTGMIYISTKETIESIEVYSTTGELIEIIESNFSSIDLSSSTEGIYFVTINTSGNSVTKRVIIQ
jgi:GEVED domain/Secretion system C-terminal sorting domain